MGLEDTVYGQLSTSHQKKGQNSSIRDGRKEIMQTDVWLPVTMETQLAPIRSRMRYFVCTHWSDTESGVRFGCWLSERMPVESISAADGQVQFLHRFLRTKAECCLQAEREKESAAESALCVSNNFDQDKNIKS